MSEIGDKKNFFFQRGDPLVFFWFSKNNQRVPPLNRKKIFVSDSTQISCVKSLGHKDCMFWISSKSETKIFFIFKGGTLWCFSDFRSLDTQAVSDFDREKWSVRLLWLLKLGYQMMSEYQKSYLGTSFGCWHNFSLSFKAER